jgi:16S rRNA (adenine1518-N6/adenine1519-N6)-dimethyltransferase
VSPRHTRPLKASQRSSAPRAPAGAPRARKELGQHFLVDPEALKRIAAAAELEPKQAVIEIGAGTGELTAALVAAGARVAAVELDEALCNRLRSRFQDDSTVRVVNANILDYEPGDLLAEAGLPPPYVVVANIPYYITAPILRRLLEATLPPLRLVLTVQREVAETIVAPDGALSLLAVSVQFYATAVLLFRLRPNSFSPPPKVDSAVVRIDVAPSPRVQVDDREAFFEVVRAGFRAPRKQLHNALSRGIWLPPGEASSLLRRAGIDPLRRAQTLTLDEWKAVYEAYRLRRDEWRQQAPHGAGEPDR